MKESDGEHYIGSIIYLIEQVNIYNKTKSAQFFESLNIGINVDQYSILDTIDVYPGICQMDLAKLILKDRSYTSRLLIFLEENDFVERRVETKGKRLIRKLYLTEKGKQIIANNQNTLKNAFIEALKDIPEEEFIATKKGLEKIKDCISKYTIMPL